MLQRIGKELKNRFAGLIIIVFALIPSVNAGAVVNDGSNDTGMAKSYDKMTITWYDVGCGDCIYIHTPDGSNILVDGGLPHNGRRVVASLKKKGIKTFDYVISTHPDDDHVGGLMYIFDEFRVKNFYYPEDCPYDTWLSKRVMLQANSMPGCNLNCPVRSDVIDGGDGAVIRFVHDDVDYKTVNEDSLAMYIDYGKLQVLLTGDTCNGSQNSIEKHNVDITDLPHHGAINAASYKFVKRFDPEYVVVSADGMTWNHPSSMFFELLEKYDSSIKVLRTDKNGDITLTADRKKWKFDKKAVEVTQYAR